MTASEYIQITHRELPVHDVRRRQPPVREPGRAHQVPAAGVRGRHQVRRHRRPHQARHPRQDLRLHPQPDLREGGGARRRRLRRHQGRQGLRHAAPAGFGKMVAMPSLDAFFDPEPRLELMKEMGIDRTLLWPTLASALEERMADDPDGVCAVIHALNEWMHEHWSYVYSDAIYSTPIISPRGRQRRARSRSSSTSTSAAPRSSSSAWRRCPRGRAASRSRCPSSTRSGSGCRSSTSSSACTRATPATPATPTSGKASATRR